MKTKVTDLGNTQAQNNPAYRPLFHAAMAGKQLQILESNGEWKDRTATSFIFPPSDYRVKPEETLTEEAPVAAVEQVPAFAPFTKTKLPNNVSPKQAYEFADIIKAAYEGYQIQHKFCGQWTDCTGVALNAPRETYRVKPVPEVIEIRKEKVWAKQDALATFGVLIAPGYIKDFKCYDVEIKLTEVVD